MKPDCLELTLTDKELVAPGVRFTRTGLLFEGQPSEQTVTGVATAIHAMRSVIDWAEADYLPQMVRIQIGRSARKRKADADIPKPQPTKKGRVVTTRGVPPRVVIEVDSQSQSPESD